VRKNLQTMKVTKWEKSMLNRDLWKIIVERTKMQESCSVYQEEDIIFENNWCTLINCDRVPLVEFMSVNKTHNVHWGTFMQPLLQWKSVTYSKFVFVALVIQHAKRMRHIVICVLLGSTIFSHVISYNGTMFGKNITEHKNVCFDLICNSYLKHFSL
jgi:hypothetical protein